MNISFNSSSSSSDFYYDTAKSQNKRNALDEIERDSNNEGI